MKIYTIIVWLLIALQCYAQERTVTGRLADENNEPLPGVNVLVKGTQNGTTTDANGNYSIDAPVGSILVFSFIGMQTQEVLVTRHGLSGIKTRIPSINLRQETFPTSWTNMQQDTTGRNKPGVAVIDDRTGRILNNGSIDPDEIVRIRKLGSNFLLHTQFQDNTKHALSFQLTNSIGIEKVNRWPSFQSTYAQGRAHGGNVQWRGAEQGEMFSYGPLVRTLEYDGSDYLYDSNGRLVSKGDGNGVAAAAHDPRSFFNNILAASHQLTTNFRLQNQSVLSGFYERRDRNGVIPNSSSSLDNFSLRLKDYSLSTKLKFTVSTSFQQSKGRLLQHGANLSNIVYSAFRTPPTFNNSNSYSHAPGLADNPYDLTKTLPDRDKLQRSTSMLMVNYRIGKNLDININSDYDYQSSSIVNGYQQRLTKRNIKQHFFNNIASLNYQGYKGSWERTARLAWHLNHQAEELDRKDTFNDLTIPTIAQIGRTTHEGLIHAAMSGYGFRMKVSNRAYFSNTVSKSSYVNLFPSASIQYDLGSKLYIEMLEPYVTVSRNIKEAPLIWSNWSHVSTRQSMQSAMSVYERGELFFNSKLSPETEAKFETGVRSILGRVDMGLSYFNNTTANVIAPVLGPDGFQLMNAARINTNGWTARATRSFYSYYPNFLIHVELNWSKYNSVVRELNVPGDFVPLAGFAETAAVLAKDQPVGAIYGTSYLRNNMGAMVIDEQGFPVVDNKLKMIGNPIPDWTAGSSIKVDFAQRFSFWTTMDYRHGGERWNGTQRVLDYYGVSQVTADQRTINNFVFEGNHASGKPNVTPVAFADPTGNTNENRWVRDGYAGAAEEYIEDASWVRMSELGVSYTTNTPGSSFVKWIRLSLTARNVFVLTKYHGVDPSGALYGYANGSGLDLFNIPGVRGFHASVSIKF